VLFGSSGSSHTCTFCTQSHMCVCVYIHVLHNVETLVGQKKKMGQGECRVPWIRQPWYGAIICGPGWLSRYSDSLRTGRYGDRIPVGARFSAPVQTGPGSHAVACTMGTGSLSQEQSGRGVTLTTDPPPPSSAEGKERSHTSTQPLGLQGLS